MKVYKLLAHAPVIDSDGNWNVYCTVQRGNSLVYGVIICETMKEAFSIKEGDTLSEKLSKKFEQRING